jgi:asparagine synthase (glutamine-hydrolysing)
MPEPNFDYDSLVAAFGASVKRNLSDGLLLSGGLDTTLIAYLMVKWGKPYCVTVALRGAPAPDIPYAKQIAASLGLEHDLHYFGGEELDEAIRDVIRVLKVFDPMEVRNSTAAYIALKQAKKHGLASVMTGDGGDELFAGYSFLFKHTPAQLDKALNKMWSKMSFSSIPMIDVRLKVREENGQTFGKWVLRKAFEKMIPSELLWRVKAPLEVGTGTTTLPAFFEARIPNTEFSTKKSKYLAQDKVTIRDKEQLFYYEIYRGLYGAPKPTDAAKKCPDCGTGIPPDANFCRTCGAYPV